MASSSAKRMRITGHNCNASVLEARVTRRTSAAQLQESVEPMSSENYTAQLASSMGSVLKRIHNTAGPRQIARSREWSNDPTSDTLQGTHTMSAASGEEYHNAFQARPSTTVLVSPEEFTSFYNQWGIVLFYVPMSEAKRRLEVRRFFELTDRHKDYFVTINNGWDSVSNDSARRQANLDTGPPANGNLSMEMMLIVISVLEKLFSEFKHMDMTSMMALMTMGAEAARQPVHMDDDASKLADLEQSQIPGQIFYMVGGGTLLVHLKSHQAINAGGGYKGPPIPVTRVHVPPGTCVMCKRNLWHAGDWNGMLLTAWIRRARSLVEAAFRYQAPPPLWGSADDLARQYNVSVSVRFFVWVDSQQKGRRDDDEGTQTMGDLQFARTMLLPAGEKKDAILDAFLPVMEYR